MGEGLEYSGASCYVQEIEKSRRSQRAGRTKGYAIVFTREVIRA